MTLRISLLAMGGTISTEAAPLRLAFGLSAGVPAPELFPEA